MSLSAPAPRENAVAAFSYLDVVVLVVAAPIVLLIGFGAYIGIFVLLVLIYGFTQHKNNEFQIQNEFKLINWVSLGVFSINRAVLYLFISAVLTIFTMVW